MKSKNSLVLIFLLITVSFVLSQTYYKIGDEVQVGDSTLTIIDIGLVDVFVKINGDYEDIHVNSTETVHGVNVTVSDIFYHAEPASRLAEISTVQIISLADECSQDYECDDGNSCTIDKCTGNPRKCSYDDSHFEITSCVSNDDCCPFGCRFELDNDCSFTECKSDFDCRNYVDKYDTCSSATCVNGICQATTITECISDDNCCPDGCYKALDNDLDCSIDNECISDSDCSDNNECTIDNCILDYVDNIKRCDNSFIVLCIHGDKCCPGVQCNVNNDIDCAIQEDLSQATETTLQSQNPQDIQQIEEESKKSILSMLKILLKKLFIPGYQ